eukprot:1139293-Pelagomonas_calceolata.AAC.12
MAAQKHVTEAKRSLQLSKIMLLLSKVMKSEAVFKAQSNACREVAHMPEDIAKRQLRNTPGILPWGCDATTPLGEHAQSPSPFLTGWNLHQSGLGCCTAGCSPHPCKSTEVERQK